MNMKFQETVILPEHLPPMSMGGETGEAAEGDMGPVTGAYDRRKPQEAVDSAERATILSALQKTGNNKTKAARLLGISLRSLYNKLERYGIKELEAKDRC